MDVKRSEKEIELESRREFLRKAGKLAVYTPPAFVALIHPGTSAIADSAGRVRGNNGLGQLFDDPQPPGLLNRPHLWNDRPSSIPGQPNSNNSNTNNNNSNRNRPPNGD